MPQRPKGPDPLAPTGAQWFYARWCALECVHLWPCPPLVREYLETGDPAQASMREGESDAAPRETAAGLTSQYVWLGGPPRLGFGADGCAAVSAHYAATGNIAGAAEHAIRALAWAALDAAQEEVSTPFTARERMEILNAGRLRLEEVFAAAAREIFEGDRTL